MIQKMFVVAIVLYVWAPRAISAAEQVSKARFAYGAINAYMAVRCSLNGVALQ